MAETTDAESAFREERRPITALFADLVGSTALAEHLDDAEVRLVVGDAVDLSRIGVRALDGLTIEFRLAVPAPYFLYVVNRPTARHSHATRSSSSATAGLSRRST